VIRSPRGNAAEMVAEKLDKKLRENLRDTRNSLFLMDATSQGGGHFSFQRPLLIVLDRNVDMATPLHHTWTYQVLISSVRTSSNGVSVLTVCRVMWKIIKYSE
jgi:hypothetical protein